MPRALVGTMLIWLGLGSNLCHGQKPAPVENVSTFGPRTPEDERKALHAPEGFEVQLVASEPDIHKPMNIAWDDQGRLWVTDTVEYPFPVQGEQPGRDTVKVLADFSPDGRARKITTFAAGLNIPIGVLPLTDGRSALVHAIPNVSRLTDTDGDGKADQRAPAYQSIGFRDTHGMTNAFTWGFDGWIYACHGFSNESKVAGSDQQPIVLQSGNTYRMRPDGSHLEYWTHGQVNPFGLAFDPLGNLYSCDCHSKPIYQLLRGAYYPSFGKPDDGLGFGPEMIAHDHGSTGIGGIAYYAADQFPAEHRDTIFIGNVVTNRINQDRLEWQGSSPKAVAMPDFVWSEDNWFRPVDLELGPDGALYVADFYNRIIGHYEVPLDHPGRDRARGRIWRIVYRGPDGKGQAVAPRADWSRATLEELVSDLGHPNLAVRMKATNQLVARGAGDANRVVAALAQSENNLWRSVHALWVAHRLGQLGDLPLGDLHGQPREVKTHALRVFGERPGLSAAALAVTRHALKDADPVVQRAAADALGRQPHTANIRPLLDLRQSADSADTHLVHVVRMALRDQLKEKSAWAFVAGTTLNERDARDLADVALGVPTADSAAFLLKHLQADARTSVPLLRAVHQIARYGGAETGAPLLSLVRDREVTQRLDLLKAIQQGTQERGTPPSADLRTLAVESGRALLGSPKNDDVLKGINLVATFPLRELRARLKTLAETAGAPEGQRGDALAALATMDPTATIALLGRTLEQASGPRGLRERAANALAGLNAPEAQAELLKVLPTAPDGLQSAIASGLARNQSGAEALLTALAAGKASARLLQDSRVADPLTRSGVAKVHERMAGLLQGLPPADQKRNELMDRRRAAFAAAPRDRVRGAAVFEKHCAACHQVGGKGARIGPQLDGVGVRGVDRLVEDILDPSRNLDQTFRVTNLALRDGRVVSGLLLREEGAVLILADAQGKEVRIPKGDVEERSTAQLSPMPANLADLVPEPEFHDLLAYLLAQAGKPEGPGR